MATGFDIRFTGDKELIRAFERLPAAVQRKMGRQGLRAGAKIVADRARQLAPRRTGALVKSITVRAGKRSRVRIVYHAQTGDRDRLGIPAKATGYYPMSQEAGWKSRGGRHIEGKSYMRRAADENVERVFAVVTDSVRQGVEGFSRK